MQCFACCSILVSRVMCIKYISEVVGQIYHPESCCINWYSTLCAVNGNSVKQVCMEQCRAVFNLKKNMCKTFANVIPAVPKLM